MQRQINKRIESIISIISCITLMASFTPAYAIEANTSGSKSTSEALLTAQPATFSVTVPTALPVNVDASGAITVATDAKISNNSAGPVKVVSCQMNALNNWVITDNPIKAKVGAKEFNFTLNDKAFGTDGSYDTSAWESIFPNDNLPLVYTSEVAPQKNAITEAMANIIFTVDWDEPITREVDKEKMSTVLKPLTGNITFRDSTEVPVTYDSAIDISAPGDGSVIAYITGQDAIVQAEGGVLAPVDASKMFYSYNATSLDLKGLDTSNVTNMEGMISACYNLTSLDVSTFNTSKVSNMKNMFRTSSALTTLDLTPFDTSNVINMYAMFSSCEALSILDLSSFDMSNIENKSGMFAKCTSLTTVYARNEQDRYQLKSGTNIASSTKISVKI